MPGSVKSDVSSLASPQRSQRKGDSNGALSPSPKKAEGPLPPPSSYIRVEYGDRRVEVYRNLKERDVTGRGDASQRCQKPQSAAKKPQSKTPSQR